MVKVDLGQKRVCANCGARYYDMKKSVPVCPACNTAYDPESQVRSRRSRSAASKPVPEVEVADDLIADVPVADDDAEEGLIEDVEELSEDVEVEEVVDVKGRE
ncbi:MAG: FYDLN acid domain-containing protein [Bdellovibrionales bacterium]